MLQAAGARAATLVVGFFCVALSTGLIFRNYGESTFAIVALFATLQTVVTFADLGLGGVVVNETLAMCRHHTSRDTFLAILRRCMKAQILVAFGMSLVVVFFGILFTASTESLQAHQALGLLIAICLVFMNIPISIGGRVLVGAGRTHQGIWLGVIAPIVAAVLTVLFVLIDTPPGFMYSVFPLGTLLASWVVLRRAMTVVGLRLMKDVLSRTFSARVRDASHPLWQAASAMLVISVASPLAYASDRVVLIRFSSTAEAASYSIGAQIFAPAVSLLAAASLPLWGCTGPTSGRPRLVIGLAGLLLATATALAIPVYARVATGEWDYVDLITLLSFSLLTAIYGVAWPLMSIMSGSDGLRFLAAFVAVSAVVGLPLSAVLASFLGAPGPLLASITTLLLFQVVPLHLRLSRLSKAIGADLKLLDGWPS